MTTSKTTPRTNDSSEPAPRSNGIRWRQLFEGTRALQRDNDDTTQVFKIIDALSGNFLKRNVTRMQADPVGRRILDEKFDLLEILSDRDSLRALPEGSLGREYLAFMEREGLSAEGLAGASESGREREGADDVDQQVFGALARDSHDLWHVLTGYGRDPLGELCLLGVLTSQIHNRGTGFIAIVGIPGVFREYPGAPVVRAVLEGFRIGRKAEWMIAQDWVALLALPLDEVRRRLRLEQPHLYRRGLSHHDPSRSRSKVAREAAMKQGPLQGAQSS